jgi:hypothetical protein
VRVCGRVCVGGQDDVFTLFVTHSHHPSMHAETRFLSSLTVAALKEKLYAKTGTVGSGSLLAWWPKRRGEGLSAVDDRRLLPGLILHNRAFLCLCSAPRTYPAARS